MSPLWTLTPSTLINAGDGSALVQLISQTSVADEIVLLGSLNVPVGPAGTEFGGIETGDDGPVLALDASLFVQLAWYFQ